MPNTAMWVKIKGEGLWRRLYLQKLHQHRAPNISTSNTVIELMEWVFGEHEADTANEVEGES